MYFIEIALRLDLQHEQTTTRYQIGSENFPVIFCFSCGYTIEVCGNFKHFSEFHIKCINVIVNNYTQFVAEINSSSEFHDDALRTCIHRFLYQGISFQIVINVDDVALYYVKYNEDEKSSSLNRIEMKEDGRIPQWPEGLFEEEMEEILAINNQRIRKRK